MPAIAMIGVYGWSADQFLGALQKADVRLLLDVRQRRGVRGPEYAWANAQRLQAALADDGIEYRHLKELAPTTEIRQRLYEDDERRGVGKRTRVELPPEYVEEYRTKVIDRVDLGAVVAELPRNGPSALFCVERDPEACHRSVIAERLAAEYDFSVQHLLPA
jgi:uncharacterized protein (DUF488 family)